MDTVADVRYTVCVTCTYACVFDFFRPTSIRYRHAFRRIRRLRRVVGILMHAPLPIWLGLATASAAYMVGTPVTPVYRARSGPVAARSATGRAVENALRVYRAVCASGGVGNGGRRVQETVSFRYRPPTVVPVDIF